MKGFMISLLGFIARLAAVVVIGYFFFIYFKNKFFDKDVLHFFVENNVFVLGSVIILGTCILLNTVDAFKKLFSVRFLKGLIYLILSVGMGFAIWFIYSNVPY